MPKVLTDAQVAQYHRDGFFFPTRIMSEADAALCEKQLRALRKKLRQIEIIEAKGAATQEELGKASKKAEILAALANVQA